MKWLLITTTGNRNTGDEFARIGVQNLIKKVDPEPEFILMDKEEWINEPLEFDKCILCGMPLFWNNEVSSSQAIGWWGELMTGWVSERKNDFLILGVGNVIGDKGIKDQIMYDAAIKIALDRAYAVTTRNFVGYYPGLINSICPAAFAIEDKDIQTPELRICNLMFDGAHDEFFNPEEAHIWKKKNKYVL